MNSQNIFLYPGILRHNESTRNSFIEKEHVSPVNIINFLGRDAIQQVTEIQCICYISCCQGFNIAAASAITFPNDFFEVNWYIHFIS